MPADYHNSNRDTITNNRQRLSDRTYRRNTKHGTLAPSVVTTVTLDDNYSMVEVVNRGSADIFFTVDGSTPTVAGDNTYVVRANDDDAWRVNTPHDNDAGSTTVVKLISSGSPDYSVLGTKH